MKATPAKKNKKINLDAVLLSVLELLVECEAEDITFSKVARKSGVSRPALYYYFGASRTTMLNEAVRLGMRLFVQLHEIGEYRKFKTWEAFENHRLQRSAARMLRYPWIPVLYTKLKMSRGPLNDEISAIESQYYNEVARVWQHFHKRKPMPAAVRFSSYLKLGLFLGLAEDRKLWRSSGVVKLRKRLLDVVSETTRQVLAL